MVISSQQASVELNQVPAHTTHLALILRREVTGQSPAQNHNLLVLKGVLEHTGLAHPSHLRVTEVLREDMSQVVSIHIAMNLRGENHRCLFLFLQRRDS